MAEITKQIRRGLLLLFCFYFISIFSQVGPRSWQDHLGLSNCNSITKYNGNIYASNYNSIFKINEWDFSYEKISKINGLNDVGIKLLRANPFNNKLLVIYDNCNIDIINSDEEIFNYSDIKSKILNGKKIINEVVFKNQFAYLSCGFGIVVFDTEKLEVKETLIIGPNGANLEVYQLAFNDSLIFAATPNGLLQSNYKTKILDTRKTTPNMRTLEKWAVTLGGGYNHRKGLYDMIMLKDNHVDVAGGITKAIEKAKSYLIQNNLDLGIEVETRNL